MKNSLVFLVLSAFLLSSCVLSGKEGTGLTTHKYSDNSVVESNSGVVTAEKALRLRTYPEGFGGYTLTTMPNDSEFTVYYCKDFSGTLWAFGAYKDSHGKAWLGYAAARYLSGGCQ